ncbi:hypothetical protein MJH12_19115 [bacterium]|nr:hypothetical protein [bacterium]
MELKIEDWIPDLNKKTATEFIVCSFYSKGKIPSKLACDILHTSRRELSEVLEKHDFDIPTSTDDDLF